ncbi:MAG: rRNA pseudouridine synthase [Clostridia bacterium]|nr:rRNA pseudouridine synthase [Clostridia bacterium]
MRINKYLALCGVSSRRNSEVFVVEGKVKINGRTVTDLATDVKDADIVTVNGVRVSPVEQHIYIMLNKPKGYVCTTSDEYGRKNVLQLLSEEYADKRIFPVGRLDFDTEGLLLLTTDGDLANRIMHPHNEVPKTYVAKVEGEISESELGKLRGGVLLDGVRTKKCKAKLKDFSEGISRVEVVITEGRNRQVRRMFDSINREVVFLKRTAIGELKLGNLYRGMSRALNDKEVEYLKKL